MHRSHGCRRAGRGAEQPAGHIVNHVDSDGNHANHDWNHPNHDWNHADDNRGLNRDPRSVDDLDHATAC